MAEKFTYTEALEILKNNGVSPTEYKHLPAAQVIRLALGKNIVTK